MIIALLTLLHLLVLVYWLGGDLGAFYASFILIDETRPVDARMAAVAVLNNVDMAPRTAIILAFPTGYALAVAKGWLVSPPWAMATVMAVFLVWLALVWRIHLKHSAPKATSRRLDMALRWITITGLVGGGVLGLIHLLPLPLFIALKMILLGTAFFAGVLVRQVLAPFGPTLLALKSGGPTPDIDTALRTMINGRSRPLVVVIWILVTAAAFLGILAPV